MTMTLWMYSFYLPLSIILAVWVGQTLHKNGQIFLLESLHGNTELADSVNQLLLVGFYLLNIGYICIGMTDYSEINNAQQVLEILSAKIGWVSVILGMVHFLNLGFLTCFKKSAANRPNTSGNHT